MVKSDSMIQFHKILNFLILILCVIVFGLMVRLLRNEYFNSKQNIVDNENIEHFNGSNNAIVNLDLNKNDMFKIVLPDKNASNELTESDVNEAEVTTGIVEDGEIKIPSTTFVGEKNNFSINDNKVTKMVSLEKNNTENVELELDSGENPFEKQSMLNKVINFLRYPDEQKYCPNIDNSESSFWAQLPEDYAGEHYAKFCCTSCFYLVSEEIYCGENETGKYVLDNFNIHDMDLLKTVHAEYFNLNNANNANNANKKFNFPETKLNSLLGKPSLKYLYNNKYYTIQIIKSIQDLYLHEADPTIMKELYKRHYKCPAIATEPVAQIIY